MCKGGIKLLQFLFIIIIFIIFFIILLISLPYRYDFSLNFKDKLFYSFSVSVLFFKITLKADLNDQYLSLKIFNFNKELKLSDNNKIVSFIENKSKKIVENKITKNNPEAEKEIVTKAKLKFYLKLITKENLNHIFKFVLQIIKKLKIDYLKLNILFSAADPYFNGLFLAYYYTFKSFFDCPDIKVKISWQEVVFKAEASAGGKIIPIKIILQFLKFIFSLKSLKIFWQLYKSNHKKG